MTGGCSRAHDADVEHHSRQTNVKALATGRSLYQTTYNYRYSRHSKSRPTHIPIPNSEVRSEIGVHGSHVRHLLEPGLAEGNEQLGSCVLRESLPT